MSDMFGFAPDPDRGRRADINMHTALADSLAHLADATLPADRVLSAEIRQIADGIRAGNRLPPLAFATYYDLARALMDSDLPAARTLARRIPAFGLRAEGRPLLITGTPAADALVRALAADGDPLLHFAPVPPDTATGFAQLMDQARALMRAHLPDLVGEIDAIIHEVLLGHAPPGAVMEFDGASHYQFWGLLMLNPKHHRTPLAVIEVLAHESAHSLLFGLTIDEPLVLNPDEATFVSPLRPDPRPMDGIYHATFVSARMAHAMERMADADGLSPADRDAAAKAAEADRANFAAGLGVVREHGKLSASGAAILANAEAWISA
jgi:HEXXH motif-containing protein